MSLEYYAEISSNPHASKIGLERATDSFPALESNVVALRALANVFGASEFLTDWLISRPGELEWINDLDDIFAPRTKKEMAKNLEALLAEREISGALRRFKHRELIGICAREISGAATLKETVNNWSIVADLAINAAVDYVEGKAIEKHGQPIYKDLTNDEEKTARFAVLAMGKLGGGELNISSDIDIMYVHTSDNGVTDGDNSISIHEFFVLIARDVTKLLNEMTEEGFVFRVDLDLRPEGKAGEITNSVGAMEIYYESWGHQWERQALIKARCCGGSSEVIEDLIDRLQPFVYRKYLDESALDDIAAMKDKIDKSIAGQPSIGGADNIKLGRGGIREIEFVAQALQLLYGARYKALRTASTLKALDACDSLGLLSTPHYRDLREAYILYRRLENRIQYFRNQQTHQLPRDKERTLILAKSLGFSGADPEVEMQERLKILKNRVRNIFDMFFSKTKDEATEKFPVDLEDEIATSQWLDSLLFDHPETSAKALNLLRSGAEFFHPSDKSQKKFNNFGPCLVAEAILTPWPDHVVLGFSNFVMARKGRNLLYDLLDNNRSIIKLLAAIFSSSESLTEVLLRQPDLFDRLVLADPVGKSFNEKDYAKEFARVIDEAETTDKIMMGINSYRTYESLRLGLRLILGISNRFELMMGLTMLAEQYLNALMRIAENQLGAEGVDSAGARWAIIAAGKVGRRETNYGSDIDLLVFYESDEESYEASHYVTTLIQTMMRLSTQITPYGTGYQLDMRLRPEGNAGPLVVSFSSAQTYFGERAQAWERMALVGARPIAGDEGFCSKILGMINSFITGERLMGEEFEGFMNIRKRIASEKIKPGATDIKFGPGGLIEIEFICQALAMEYPEALIQSEPFTMAILKMAKTQKWLSSKDLIKLEKAYMVYRSLEDTLRMNRERALDVIPKSNKQLIRRLAHSVEMADISPDDLVGYLKEMMGTTQAVYQGFFQSLINERSGATP